MKFFAATVALALAATASAQTIAINDPTTGSIWEVGKPQHMGWTGNCASMGAAAANVSIQIVDGPSTSVRYRGEVGTLNCSGNVTTSITNAIIPPNIESGNYSLRVLTLPDNSYSAPFSVVNPAMTTTPATPTSTTGAPKTTSGATKVATGSMALVGVVAAMLL